MNIKQKEEKSKLEKYIGYAYKKLKSNSYYDNRNMFLKNRIVDFENHGIEKETSENLINSIENKFKQIQEMIESEKIVEFNFVHSSDFENNNLNSEAKVDFTIRSVPKSIIDYKYKNKMIENFEEKCSNATVDKLMHYLDIDISSQIIGALWVMIIGKEIEKEYEDYTAGNILEDDININDESLKLFKPYYLAYERWRDDAINIVEDRINRGKRSTMLSLDIKEYYYSININIESSKAEILKIFEKSKMENFISKNNFEYINNYVFSVIEEYSKAMHLNYFSDNQGIENKNILPIGFLPSSILSNWYLHEFDESVNSKLTPLYYKRYVDDILIVLNTDYKKQKAFSEEEILNNKFYDTELFEIGVLVSNEEDVVSKENENIKEMKSTEIIILDRASKFLDFTKKIDRIDTKLKENVLDIVEGLLKDNIPEGKYQERFDKEDLFLDWANDNPIVNKCKPEELEKVIKDINKKLKVKSSKFKKIYLLKDYKKNEEDYLAYLIIQDEKVKLYDFASGGSKALIENFKKEINKNSSAFKFLPQKDEVLNSFDSEVYKVSYKDSIHKLSSIENFKISRYNLSKFLARIIYSDKLENDDYTKDVDEKILWIFKGRHAVEYFFLWDKVFNYYLMNKRYSLIKNLFVNIYNSIENLKFDLAKFSLINVNCNGKKEKDDDKRIINLKADLKSYLRFVLAMNYALDDGIFINNINDYNSNDYEKINQRIEEELGNKNQVNTDGLYKLKENIRVSNMMNHSLIRSPLMNYYYLKYKECHSEKYKNCYSEKYNIIDVNFVNSVVGKPEILSDRIRCFLINSDYENCTIRRNACASKGYECDNCVIELCEFAVKYSPRFVHLHECILNSISNLIAKGKVISKGKEILEAEKDFYKINGINEGSYNINMFKDIRSILNSHIMNSTEDCENNTQELSDKEEEKCEKCASRNHNLNDKLLNTHFRYFDLNNSLFIQKERVINYLDCGKYEKKDKLKIGIVNMKIYDDDLVSGFKKTPNINSNRLQKISGLLNKAVKNGAEVIVFPEVSIPIEWLGVISDFARRHDVLIICGLEHIVYDNKLCCNYIATILPDKYEDYTYAVVKLRLKNHYSPKEKEWVRGYGWELPIERNEEGDEWKKEYDLFRWKGVDFSTFSCFELANIQDRALFTSFVDLLIGSVHNRDVNYYSNIMESLARDVHCYFVHVNDSALGDNRIIKPACTNTKDILQVSGGLNDVVLIGEIDIKSLREFQIKDHNLQIGDSRFKAVPPEYNYKNVKIRDGLPL